MIEFLNACIFFLGVGAIACLIAGQEDGPPLALLAIAAIVARVFLWLVHRRLGKREHPRHRMRRLAGERMWGRVEQENGPTPEKGA